jgi:hypothetical protein
MAYIREKKRGSLKYYYLVEGRREGKKVRQKVLKYLGTSPNTQEIELDPKVAGVIAQAIMTDASTTKVKKVLKEMGIPVKGRLKKVILTFNPPLKKLTLRVE